MGETEPKGSYTYPNISHDPDRRDVLRNKLGNRSHKELRVEEYRATAFRMAEIAEGDGPKGAFDAQHLKAIHGHIFQDIYEWAGHTRNESPVVDGQRVEPIGNLSKGGTSFLHGSRIEMGLDEAFRPIRNPEILRGSSVERFAEIAGKVLAELNYVHPFREGNGRAQEALLAAIGREYGHDVDFTVITKPRMIEASIATTNDPSSPAMKHVFEDAIDPNRQEAIRAAFVDLEMRGDNAFEHNVRSARPGEQVSGQVLGHDIHVASLVTDHGIVAVDRADLPERLPDDDTEITFTARSDFSLLSRPDQVRSSNGPALERMSPEQKGAADPSRLAELSAQKQPERDSDDRER
ncbi:Fic family protein (plasmid) [Brucella anthropi]|uniref:protein adenylyltransferase n=1 Tax=Brucella anthropi (strain ATCC 49188 / DSM 6882 / CCUG 24695 / JCM 21032 / LMG 3331 / NBRC 15819 / NCTC 12168 / Alc 37) TaxID=439375 RepID=A6X7M7_BRUA4|nr:Fic family protein [Brucella anthropi]ABS17231.1 filamentation induced by cAMP protein Fic [Brucella anthropi ATCC 49188]KAB2729877.1 cell filamentation protein Fic [Brucella anthropi]QQC26882.1 Fic family protein [Brucella anthropi]